jgi:hypothetical protein
LPLFAFSESPTFHASLQSPRTFIAPIPVDEPKFLISLDGYVYPPFKRFYETKPLIGNSSYSRQTLTITGQFYKKGDYVYDLMPRTVNATEFMQHRRKYWLSRQLTEIRSQALSKQQKQKAGGLLAINVPIKSQTFESVFGEGGAGLKVSGSHQITFSGRSQWDDRTSTATYKQSKFPSLNMEQISRFDINGNIGSKITVQVSQDSKTDIPLANRIMLRYKGDENDIIKIIEAGNTTLSLPNTRFVGYSARIQGLFGIKTEAQIGNLKLTAIASQEKGSTERNSISAGATARKDYKRDWEYATGRIFDLGRKSEDIDKWDFLKFISIYTVPYASQQTTSVITAKFYVDPVDTTFAASEASEALVYAEPLREDDYYIDNKKFYAIFNSPNGGSYGEIGVFMIVQRKDGIIDTIGDLSAETLKLKLIKSRRPDSTQYTWDYMWRNVYYLGSTQLDPAGLDVTIYKGLAGTERTNQNIDNQNGTAYIQILGLDTTNQSGKPIPDGKIDVNTPIIDPIRGFLIFPEREPFASQRTFLGDTTKLEPQVPGIYTNEYGTSPVTEASKYYFEISNTSRANEISLGRTNIIEGSERITLNGRLLTKGQDYNVDYDFGRVTFLTQDATDPNANINIEYEFSPLMSMEKKTLFGIRTEYDLNENFQIGSTFLYKSDKATERKPKIGQETARTMMFDIDGSFKLKPNFLSKMANLLPFYSTKENSNLAISAEVAQSHPNPNVDGVAYIDDFEGSRDLYSFGIYRELWTLASKPIGLDSTRMRGRLIWYNPYDQIPTNEIWNKDVSATENLSHTLWFDYIPSIRDKRANDSLRGDTAFYEASKAWGGVMRYLPAGSANQSRAQLLEMRVKGTKGVIHVDLGRITEDVNVNGSLDTEDKATGTIYNNILDEGEDIGLDGIPDSTEGSGADPHDDNWYYNGEGLGCNGCDPDDYSHINGTEGNEKDPNRWGKPDTEDLLRNNALDSYNSYYSFRVNIEDENYYVDSSEYNGWKTFRIPIKDPDAIDSTVGNPSWTQIEFIRLWFESPDGDSISIKIASADFIQSNWDDTVKFRTDTITPSSSKFNVAVINDDVNINYSPPPGVSGYYDKTNAVTETEQSLLLRYDSLAYCDTGIAERILYDAPSLMGYKTLKMYVHGEQGADSVLFFCRIGADSANYYEYHTRLKPGWDTENEVNLNFDEISGLKEYLIRNRQDSATMNLPYDTTDGNYRVRGKPTLTQIKYLACGVTNLDPTNIQTGDVWVDEMRLVDVRRDVGAAGRVSVAGNVADLFSYGTEYSHRDSYFREMSSSTRGGSSNNLGGGEAIKTYGYNISTGFDKFLPRSLGLALPISFSFSKNTKIPRLRFGTDITLPNELRDKESTVGTSRGFNFSESFNRKTRNPLFTLFLNKIRTSYSYSRSEGRSPANPITLSKNYHSSGSYSLDFGKIPSIKPFFWTKPIPLVSKLSGSKFYFFPNSFSSSGDYDKHYSLSQNLNRGRIESTTKNFNGNYRLSYKVSDNLLLNYNASTKRDMSDPEKVNLTFNPGKLRLGKETNFSESFGASYSPAVFSFFTHKFTFNTTYGEAKNVTDTSTARSAQASKSYSISGNLDFRKMFAVEKKKDAGRRDLPPQQKGKVTKVEKKKNPIETVWNPVSRVMGLLTGWINPITYEYHDRFSYGLIGLMDRASWKFRLGLTDEHGARVDEGYRAVGSSNFISENIGYSFGSGTKFLGGLKTDVSFNRKINKDVEKTVNPQKSIETVFPDIKFTIGSLSTIKIFNPIIQRFSPRTGYSKSRSESYNLQTGFKSSERTTISQRPLLSFSFDIARGLQINFSTDKIFSEDKAMNSQTGVITSRKRDLSRSYSVDSRYSFTAPTGIRIPLLGRIKFSSTATISADVTLRKQKTENASGTSPYVSAGERSDLTITPTISYSFSTQIRGGLSGRWQDTDDKTQKRTSHTRELKIWVDIKF